MKNWQYSLGFYNTLQSCWEDIGCHLSNDNVEIGDSDKTADKWWPKLWIIWICALWLQEILPVVLQVMCSSFKVSMNSEDLWLLLLRAWAVSAGATYCWSLRRVSVTLATHRRHHRDGSTAAPGPSWPRPHHGMSCSEHTYILRYVPSVTANTTLWLAWHGFPQVTV